MDKNEIFLLLTLVVFSIIVFGSVWLINRAQPEKRIYWFTGFSILSVMMFGIIQGPVAIVFILGVLAMLKREDNNPINDIKDGLMFIFSSGLSVLFFWALYAIWYRQHILALAGNTVKKLCDVSYRSIASNHSHSSDWSIFDAVWCARVAG